MPQDLSNQEGKNQPAMPEAPAPTPEQPAPGVEGAEEVPKESRKPVSEPPVEEAADTARQVIAEEGVAKTPAEAPTESTQTVQSQIAAIAQSGKLDRSFLATLTPEQQVEALAALAQAGHAERATKLASATEDPFIIDRLHDAMVEKNKEQGAGGNAA